MKNNIRFLLLISILFILLAINNANGKEVDSLIFTKANWKGKEVACKVLQDNSLIFQVKEKGKWKNVYKFPFKDKILIKFVGLSNHGQIVVGYKKGKKRFIRIFEVRNKGLFPIKTEEVSLLPSEVQIKKYFLDKDIIKTIVPKIPFSPHNFSFLSPSPSHVIITNKDKDFMLRIYPLDDYINMWLDHGDLSIKIAVSRIKRYLETDKKISPPLDIIPPRPGLNDLAIFIEKLLLKNIKGIGFVGRVVKDIICVEPEQLQYFFVGITNDEKFIVSFESRLTLKENCPKKLWQCKRSITGIQKQIDEIKNQLPLCKQGFIPSLSEIKAFLNSISITTENK